MLYKVLSTLFLVRKSMPSLRLCLWFHRLPSSWLLGQWFLPTMPIFSQQRQLLSFQSLCSITFVVMPLVLDFQNSLVWKNLNKKPLPSKWVCKTQAWGQRLPWNISCHKLLSHQLSLAFGTISQVLSFHHGGRTIQKRVIKINEKLTLGWLFLRHMTNVISCHDIWC